MIAAPLGRGPKLNTLAEEDNEALDRQRREWLRRLEAPRGKAAPTMPHAVWDETRGCARVTRTKGKDLQVIGYHAEGEQWRLISAPRVRLRVVPPHVQPPAGAGRAPEIVRDGVGRQFATAKPEAQPEVGFRGSGDGGRSRAALSCACATVPRARAALCGLPVPSARLGQLS